MSNLDSVVIVGGGLAGLAAAAGLAGRGLHVELVHPGHRRRGIGRRLLAALIRRAEAQGFRQMIAVIGDSGNAASIALHERLGFAHAGTLRSVGFKFGRWLDLVFLQRFL